MYYINKYKYSDAKKRKQFKKLLKEEKVSIVKNKGMNDKHHFIYQSDTSIKIIRG
jgi:hypothetical protein